MSDMITAEAADFAWPVGGYAPGGYMCKCSTCGKTHMAEKRAWQCADCVIQRLHAQLADAKAAQAMVVERAAAYHDAEIAALDEQIKENSKYLRRRHGEAGVYAHASEANDYCRTQITIHRMSAAAIRSIADTDGLALVQALRDRAEKAEARVGDLEAALSGGVLSKNDARDLLSRLAAAEADRDRLAAANAALEAQVVRLVGALTPSGDTKAAYMGEIKDPDTKRMVSWTAIKMVMAMISARAAHASAQGVVLAVSAPSYAEDHRAALAKVQADARREGGE